MSDVRKFFVCFSGGIFAQPHVLHVFKSNNRLTMQEACMIRPVKLIENEIESENETGEATNGGGASLSVPHFRF